MLQSQTTPKVIFVVFFFIIFLASVLSASASFSGLIEVDLCCDYNAERQLPTNEAECSDPDCRCLSCSVSANEFRQFSAASTQDPPAPSWLLASVSLFEFIRSIDYPPEHL